MSRRICVQWTSNGTGLQSFAFPVSGTIVQVQCGSQTAGTVASVSVNGTLVPTAGLFNGQDGGLIASMQGAGGTNAPTVPNLNFTIDQGQLVFIDVKLAATFAFYVDT